MSYDAAYNITQTHTHTPMCVCPTSENIILTRADPVLSPSVLKNQG